MPDDTQLVFAPLSGDVVTGAGEDITANVIVIAPTGDTLGGIRVGTIMVQMPQDVDQVELTSVNVAIDNGAIPRTYDVGRWSFTRLDSPSELTVTGAYPANMPTCSPLTIDLECERDDLVTLSPRITLDHDGITREEALSPTLFGYIDISEEFVEHVLDEE
ncbi:hypothetical protein [Microbacterium amylolyticum]|uniref:Uncharacterized protein n=1 Tax=Microbacterium amylolyticum TaxID=936337 RepID=A0ABS4ZKL6_9MICO|nr:hypothetical protein [Microbacterium amylolyticum]MBP2437543.1 hypothetical protein [Microbacterium amylolyticum]